MLAEVVHHVIQIDGKGPFVWWPLILLGIGIFFMLTSTVNDSGFSIVFGICLFIGGLALSIALQTTVKIPQDQIRVDTGTKKVWVNAHRLEDGTWWPDK